MAALQSFQRGAEREAEMRRRNLPRQCERCRRRAIAQSAYCQQCFSLHDRWRLGKPKQAPPLNVDQLLYLEMLHIERDLLGPPGNIRTSAQILEPYAIG